MEKTIGIIGFGNMGSAIAERIKSTYKVSVFDKDRNKTNAVSGIEVAENTQEIVKNNEVIILAVKPQDFDGVLNEMKGAVKDKLIISIAAGITTAYIEKILKNARVIRVMPNIGVKIGEAESALCKGKSAAEQDLSFSKELFANIGKTWVMKENMIDAATAISGSGPAYIFNDMEIKRIDPHNVPKELEQEYIKRLKEAAERVGFDSQTAFDLAASTTATSLSLSATSDKSLSELRKLITSKGGTTEAALKIIYEKGNWSDAALAAKKHAEKLSKRE
jgi:pyrroline-5-carboxylate reductase